MLIKITRSCHNGCTHCCNDSKPSDDHMTLDTFKDVLEFVKKYDYNAIHELAGGEPFEHPQIFEFIDTFYEYFPHETPLLIATNGHYLASHQEEVVKYFDKYFGLFCQVTYDDRFYPKKLDTTKRIFHHKKVGYVVERIDHVFPIGRAVTNKIPIGDKIQCPPCINLKLLLMQVKNATLKEFFTNLRKMNKNCIPSIMFDGSIRYGEYDCCPKEITIYDSEDKILSAIYNNECEECKEAFDIFFKKINSGELRVLSTKR